MDAFEFITHIREAGFAIRLVDGNLAISPASRLDDEQRQWIRANKGDLVSALQSPGTEIDTGQGGHDLEPANEPEPILATAWTPAGGMMLVPATSPERATWIERMNPKLSPLAMVCCCDCQQATINNGIASCAAGVPSGLPIAGFWATDRHLCGNFEARL